MSTLNRRQAIGCLAALAAEPLPKGVAAVIADTLKQPPGSLNTDWFGTLLVFAASALLIIPLGTALTQGLAAGVTGIGQTGSASLAVVAPGIAEALIATAIGLVAAIPAVMAYNHFQHKIRVLIGEMDNFSTEFLNIVQRTFSK